MNRTTRGIVAGTLGGLAAGAILAGAMIGSQMARLDKADNAVRIGRRTGERLGVGRRRLDERPSVQEEALARAL